MFKCDICRKTAKSREKMHKVAVLFRDKTYINYDKKGNEKLSKGKEIVKEVNMCENCFRKESD